MVPDSAQAASAGHRVGPGAAAGVRYRVLDALRGLCALLVCLFHFRVEGPLAGSAFIAGSWLFVDFFFVLSGFVIACSWGDRLISPNAVGRFVVLRLGRIYPLHMFMLLLFLAVELCALAIKSQGLMQRAVFDQQHSMEGWLLSAGMVQIFGFWPTGTWNHPSWSIAAEFWTYLLFAGVMLVTGRRSAPVLAALAVGSIVALALLSPNGIDATYDHSVWRSLCGFCIGALLWQLAKSGRVRVGGTLAELVAVAVAVLFVALGTWTPFNLIAPLVFAAVIMVFLNEGGIVSRLLLQGWAQRLGLWSFSIYMVHVFVVSRLEDVMRLGRPLGLPSIRSLSQTALGETMICLVMLALVVSASALTYRWIEMPGQRMARRLADRLGG